MIKTISVRPPDYSHLKAFRGRKEAVGSALRKLDCILRKENFYYRWSLNGAYRTFIYDSDVGQAEVLHHPSFKRLERRFYVGGFEKVLKSPIVVRFLGVKDSSVERVCEEIVEAIPRS